MSCHVGIDKWAKCATTAPWLAFLSRIVRRSSFPPPPPVPAARSSTSRDGIFTHVLLNPLRNGERSLARSPSSVHIFEVQFLNTKLQILTSIFHLENNYFGKQNNHLIFFNFIFMFLLFLILLLFQSLV